MSPPLKPSRLRLALVVIAGVGLAGCKRPPAYDLSLSTKDVMHEVIDPASLELWNNSGFSDGPNGSVDKAPTTDEGWARVVALSSTVAEGGNMIRLPARERHIDKADKDNWDRFAKAMTEQALASRSAALAKDSNHLFETGGALYQTCVACHEKYLLPFIGKDGKVHNAPGA